MNFRTKRAWSIFVCLSLVLLPIWSQTSNADLVTDATAQQDAAAGEVIGSTENAAETLAAEPGLHCFPRTGMDSKCDETKANGGSCDGCGDNDGSGADTREPVTFPPASDGGVATDAPGFFNSDTGSSVDNTFYNYKHMATDAPQATGSGLVLQRYHRSRDAFRAGSFGRGVVSNFDFRLYLDLDESGIQQTFADELGFSQVRLVVPTASTRVNFEIESGNKLRPQYDNVVEKMEMLDSAMNPVNQGDELVNYTYHFPGAVYAKITAWNRDTFLFELVNAQPDPSWDPVGH